MDSSEALKQFDQKFNELKKSLETKHNNNNKCYVLFDLRMKALCGVYLDEDVVRDLIDKRHREDMKLEMDALRLKIINGDEPDYNTMTLYSMENYLKYYGANNKLTGYVAEGNLKTNYLYYCKSFNDFDKKFIHFQDSNTENVLTGIKLRKN